MHRLRQNKQCKECGEPFSCPLRSNGTAYSISSKTWSGRTFCSNRCAKPQRSIAIGLANNGHCSVAKANHLQKLAASRVGRPRSPFSAQWIKKLSESHIGQVSWNKGRPSLLSREKHPNWKGGITPATKLLRTHPRWHIWRKKIFERDNYKCLDCGSGKDLNPHHIIPLRLSKERIYQLTNGITLCRQCHLKTFGKEPELAKMYFSFVQALT